MSVSCFSFRGIVRTPLRGVAAITLLALAGWTAGVAEAQAKITVNYATRTGTTWPLYIAQDGGYFAKNGIEAKLAFAVHPAGIAMLVSGEAQMNMYPLEQAMMAASKDGSLVMMGSPYRKSLFALMGAKGIGSVKELKGKKIGVSQIGDAPYNYSVGLLAKAGLAPRDVQWVPVGTDVNGRAAALAGGRVDATMLTAPVYFKLEAQGFKSLANTSDYDDIYAPTVYVFKKAWAAANPALVESIIKAHTEAIARYYADKNFALDAYIAHTQEDRADIERVYDIYNRTNTYERIPYIQAAAVKYMIDHPVDAQVAAELKAFDFHKVIDHSVVDKLVKEGYFERVFGASIKAEQERRSKAAFR